MLSWDGKASLKIQVMDHDNFKSDDSLGDCEVDLLAIAHNIPLIETGEFLPFDLPLRNVPHGSIQFQIQLNKLS